MVLAISEGVDVPLGVGLLRFGLKLKATGSSLAEVFLLAYNNEDEVVGDYSLSIPSINDGFQWFERTITNLVEDAAYVRVVVRSENPSTTTVTTGIDDALITTTVTS